MRSLIASALFTGTLLAGDQQTAKGTGTRAAEPTAAAAPSVPVWTAAVGIPVQVVGDAERPLMEAALSLAPMRDTTICVSAGLQHLFQPRTINAMIVYEQISMTVDEAVLAELRDSLVRRLTPAVEKLP